MHDSDLVRDTFKALGDRRACELLVASASDGIHPKRTMKKAALTRKQFYSRLSRLKKLKLIKKTRGNYAPTLLGLLVINNILPMMEAVIGNRWKIDSIDKLMTDKEIPADRMGEIVDSLLRDSVLREPIIHILQNPK